MSWDSSLGWSVVTAKSRLSKPMTLVLAFIFLLVIDYVDYSLGLEFPLTVLLLIPIYLVVWNTNLGYGLFFSFLGAGFIIIEPLITHHASKNTWLYILDGFALFTFYATVSYILFTLKDALEKATQLARTDGLTGLMNARAFFEATEMERSRSVRYGHSFTFCYVDLDNFKKVNDTRGHLVGDDLLKSFGETLKRLVRASDLVARLGGDEFAILFPETGPDAVEVLVSKLRDGCAKCMVDGKWDMTASMGIATFCKIPDSVEEIVHVGDQLMYKAKAAGKNQFKMEVIERS